MSTPDSNTASIDTNQLHHHPAHTLPAPHLPQPLDTDPDPIAPPDHHHVQQVVPVPPPPSSSSRATKPKPPSVRRACTACHAGKTRCSEVLPCQSCLKRGLGASCAYPDPDAPPSSSNNNNGSAANASSSTNDSSNASQNVETFTGSFATPMYPSMHGIPHSTFFEYNSTFTPQPPTGPAPSSTSTFRPAKRPRPLTEEETAAIRNWQRGDFYVGSSAPVRIDPRLPVRLTLGEGDHVDFAIGEPMI